MKTRITVDIDGMDFKKIKKAVSVIETEGYSKLLLRQSPSKNGYHLIAFMKKQLNQKKIMELRAKAGDDKKRMFWDKKSNRARQVLFSEKKFYRRIL